MAFTELSEQAKTRRMLATFSRYVVGDTATWTMAVLSEPELSVPWFSCSFEGYRGSPGPSRRARPFTAYGMRSASASSRQTLEMEHVFVSPDLMRAQTLSTASRAIAMRSWDLDGSLLIWCTSSSA